MWVQATLIIRSEAAVPLVCLCGLSRTLWPEGVTFAFELGIAEDDYHCLDSTA